MTFRASLSDYRSSSPVSSASAPVAARARAWTRAQARIRLRFPSKRGPTRLRPSDGSLLTCGGVCFDPKTDSKNCGDCGIVCGSADGQTEASVLVDLARVVGGLACREHETIEVRAHELRVGALGHVAREGERLILLRVRQTSHEILR